MNLITRLTNCFYAIICFAMLAGCAGPESNQSSSTATLKVISGDEMYLNNKKVDIKSLPQKLENLRADSVKITVILDCAKNVPAPVVMKVLDAAKSAGQTDIKFNN